MAAYSFANPDPGGACGLVSATMPSLENPDHELFVVEGVSAADAVANVCDPKAQFVYAVQGKPMNVVRATDAEVAANARVDEIVRRLDRNRSEEFDPHHVPYARIILLTDADVDGVHAKALLLALIARAMPNVIEAGRLFTVRAPSFSVNCAELDEPVFAYSPEGRDHVIAQLRERNATRVESRHYKGLAGMNADMLWRACVNPETRRLTPLTAEHLAAARQALD